MITRELYNRIKTALGIIAKGSAHENFNFVPLLGTQNEKLSEPFRESTWVMRAIKMISGPISSVPLEFEAEGSEEDISDPMLSAFWKRPCYGMDQSDMVEAFVGWMKMAGEFFVVLDDTWSPRFPEAMTQWSPLIVARPDRMREVIQGRQLIGWHFTDASGSTHALLPEQVIQTKYWNPYNEWRGLPEYEAARMAAETDWLNQRFASNVATSNGDTGPIISAKGPGLSDSQVKQIVAQLEAKRRAQLRGEFVPAFLNGEVSIEDAKVRSPDATFQAQRVMDKEQIAIAFGIPPSMFSVQASYSIGSASDYFRLIETSCMPIGKKLCGLISLLSSRMMDQPLNAYWDWDEHSTVQQVRNERISSATSL